VSKADLTMEFRSEKTHLMKHLPFVAGELGREAVRALSVMFLLIFLSWPVLAGSVAAASQTETESPLNGEWRLNIQKSAFANMPIPQHAILIIHVTENTVVWKTRGVDAGGQAYDYTLDGKLDDKPYVVSGTPSTTTISFKSGNGALVGRWKDAHGERVSIITVSPDGKTLTVENSGTDAEQTSNWTEVWDKAGK
jgi:hypothetical protein